MLVQLDDLYTTSKYLLPWSTFLIGIIGSLHCAGMCGGLALSCSPTIKNNGSYQLGRLFSYSLLALLSGFIGSYFHFSKTNPIFSVIPGVLIGLVLIWIGLKVFLKNSNSFQLPPKINQFIYRLWGKFLPKNNQEVTLKNSFFVGSFSILLPCGLLYGVILTLGAFNTPLWSLVCIFTFWLGTLPMMAFTPNIIKIILKPLSQRMPLITSSVLIVVGLGTIISRVYMSYQVVSCH